MADFARKATWACYEFENGIKWGEYLLESGIDGRTTIHKHQPFWYENLSVSGWVDPQELQRHSIPDTVINRGNGTYVITSSTAQGGGGSFKNRKPIGEIGCCESGMAERIHWWTERCLRSPLFLSLSLTIYPPTNLSSMYLSTYLPIYLSTYLPVCLSVCRPVYLWCSVIQCNVA